MHCAYVVDQRRGLKPILLSASIRKKERFFFVDAGFLLNQYCYSMFDWLLFANHECPKSCLMPWLNKARLLLTLSENVEKDKVPNLDTLSPLFNWSTKYDPAVGHKYESKNNF